MRRRGFLQLLLPPGAMTAAERDALAERLAPLFGHDLADTPPVVNDQLKAMRAADATPRLGELAGIPTLVMCGTHDPIAPPTLGKALATGIPGGEVHRVRRRLARPAHPVARPGERQAGRVLADSG